MVGPILFLPKLAWNRTYIIWILLYVAFCNIVAISRQKKAKSWDYALLLFRMTSRVLFSAQYHRRHCTLQDFEQFGALYMDIYDDNIRPDRDSSLVPPGYKPQSLRMSHRGRDETVYIYTVSAGQMLIVISIKNIHLTTLKYFCINHGDQTGFFNLKQS